MKNLRSLHYYCILKLYYTLYTIKLKICTQRFYYSSSKFSKFSQGKFPLLQQLASVSLLKEKSKIARASTKTFISRIHIRQPSPKNSEKNLRQPKNSLAGSLVSRDITVQMLYGTQLQLQYSTNNVYCDVYNSYIYKLILYNFSVHIRLCTSYVDDLTTVPCTGNDSMSQRMFRRIAVPDGGPVRLETCRSVVK